MISNIALSVNATGSRTRVYAFVSLACFVGGTVRVYNTFRSTCYIGISKVFRYTLAGCCTAPLLAISIRTTRCWITWINIFSKRRLSGFYSTRPEWIPLITWITDTAGIVIIDSTICIGATHPRTRIYTFVSNTGLVIWTLRISCTFWFTFSVRVSKESWKTCASCSIVSFPTLGIYSTGGRPARVNYFRSSWCSWNDKTVDRNQKYEKLLKNIYIEILIMMSYL